MSLFDKLGNQPQQSINPMQKLQELKQNPANVLSQAGFSVPSGMTDPMQITQHLLTSGQIPQARYNRVLQMMGRR